MTTRRAQTSLGRRARARLTTLGALVIGSLCCLPALAAPIEVNGEEAGLPLGENFLIWHDPSGSADLAAARAAFSAGQFKAPEGGGSTGLAPGAFWSRFELRNAAPAAVELRLEYIDHQLIYLRAFQGAEGSEGPRQVADLSLENPFVDRPVQHHRFVVPVRLAAGEQVELYVRYGSHDMGFVFPELRIWSPASLTVAQSTELTVINVIGGG
ncbi:MAG: 7TM-DISM domain-containing protein, partial [Pseudomonadota bacterium]